MAPPRKRTRDLMPKFLNTESFDEFNQRLNNLPAESNVTSDEDAQFLESRKCQSKRWRKEEPLKLNLRSPWNVLCSPESISSAKFIVEKTCLIPVPSFEEAATNARRCLNTSSIPGSSGSASETNSGSDITKQDFKNDSPSDSKKVQGSSTSKSAKPKVIKVYSFVDLVTTTKKGNIQTEESSLNHEKKLGTVVDIVEPMKCDERSKEVQGSSTSKSAKPKVIKVYSFADVVTTTKKGNIQTEESSLNHEKKLGTVVDIVEPMKCDERSKEVQGSSTSKSAKLKVIKVYSFADVVTTTKKGNIQTEESSLNHEKKLGTVVDIVEPMKCDERSKEVQGSSTSKSEKPKVIKVYSFADVVTTTKKGNIQTEESSLNHEKKLGTVVDIVEPMKCDEGSKCEVTTTNKGKIHTEERSLNHEKKLGTVVDIVEPMKCDEGSKCEVTTTNKGNTQTEERSLNHEKKLGIGVDIVEPMKCDEGTKCEVTTTNKGKIQTEERSLNYEKKLGIGVDIVEPMKCDEENKCEVNADTFDVAIVEPMKCNKVTKCEVNVDTTGVNIVEPMKCNEVTKCEVNVDTIGVDIVEPMKCNEESKCEVNADTMSLQKRSKRAVSLVERFTEEEIKLHIMSLKKPSTQSAVEGMCDLKEEEESCQLCDDGTLLFPPQPLYCLLCSRRIDDRSFYYTPGEEELSNAQHQICSPCHSRCKTKFPLCGVFIDKHKMLKRSNFDNADTEEWVQCESCEKWQHQICGLYNKLKDEDKTAEYICPTCLLEECQSINNMALVDYTDSGAKDLPETVLSYFLEQRLFKRLKEERYQTAKAIGKSINDVPEPEGLTLRVVFSADRTLTVNKQFASLLHKENFPSEFPYRSKVILLFQKVHGVDICIFALFVQEFGSECSQPNQRSTYIFYLDSVKYFKPERVTFAGEALRTFVYHEVLIGYLEYCKLRGFTTSYIWACPPKIGQDYIMYSHPKTQQTPDTKKLRKWYVSMLQKAAEQRVVMNVTNLYDRFFDSTEEYMTAARLPYFEGSFWSNRAEIMIQDIEREGNNELQKKVKLLSRRKVKTMSYKTTGDVDVDDVKNILLMEKLEKEVFPNKKDLMVVELNYSCTRCSKAVLSGLRWFCEKCKNLHLCESCYDAGQELPGEHIYKRMDKEKHQLSKVQVNGVLFSTTEDNDIIQENDMFESRQAFLAFSQKHNYNFHTLRHAKHSSMMILHHLHTSNKHHCSQNSSSLTCTACKKDVSTTIYFPCLLCPDYRACTGCYTKNRTLRHLHIFPTLPSANRAPSRTVMVLEILNAISHALLCQHKTTKSCSYPKCHEVKALFTHNVQCKIRKKGTRCNTCYKLWQTIRIHVYHCQDLNCPVPQCRDRKEVLIRKV
ncbi:Histone acetyltransferase [Arabidopsis suecica]|uniref:histone acetyltransferase n=1 Tax=Arabidopsis suecica TaxID=45249 RepID=A0A8T2HGR5_ARASU|nr:Histone acetyltransferase [Arabidopsis suecica]